MADDAPTFHAVPNEELAFLGIGPVPAAPYANFQAQEAACRHLYRSVADLVNGADARLLDLLLALTQVALAVEQQQDAEPGHARVQARFVIERTSADFGRDRPRPSATC